MGKFIIPSDASDPNTARPASQIANEMRSYPDGHTGDSLMALWFSYSEIRDRTSNMLVIPQGFMAPKVVPNLKDKAVRAEEEKKADTNLRAEQEWERSNFLRIMRKG